MKILHTSDWHLGRTLYGKKRHEEFIAFLDWLFFFINQEKIDILLVAGDIFDTTTPSNKAQEIYYRFLCRIAADSCCKHVVIIAGNHDSPSFLSAPKELLKTLNVTIASNKEDNPEDEVIVLKNDKNMEELAVLCAVPYLRDRDIRSSDAGESIEEKHRKLIAGIENHYNEIANIALKKRQQCYKKNIPIIGMGHLFAAGGKTCSDDGVRELYVGSLAYVNVHSFAPGFDYLALGHLHVPQKVGGFDHVRYSGSPIPMGFGESNQEKSVVVVEFEEEKPRTIKQHTIPSFQKLERITGDLPQILEAIDRLKEADQNIWLEIEYNGTAFQTDLRQQIEERITGSKLEIRRIKNNQVYQHALSGREKQINLEELDVYQVFDHCLEKYEIDETERNDLRARYQNLVQELEEQDENKE